MLTSVAKTLSGYLSYMYLIKMNTVLNLYIRKLWANLGLTLRVTYLLYDIMLALLNLLSDYVIEKDEREKQNKVLT